MNGSEGELFLSGIETAELFRTLLEGGGRVRFRARGFSMSPFVRNNDVLTISPLREQAPAFGEVVAFIRRASGRFIVHRVIGKRGDSFVIKGDNAHPSYDLVEQSSIFGRVTGIDRDGNKIRLGIGPERTLIAFFSRKKYPLALLFSVWRSVCHVTSRSGRKR